ncbi:hypothetical protein BpOF4_00505 [Alkalihalophilus pseudofirmus OF4]|jgi:hypothetical protein|uniref:Uncharacterized protein n=2 Tax=Alkalihalophilus TaxID=2893060 RepID=D3FTA2_ALKPO|nr:hypothetical protein BpOF4_00505 [Alkalihalophilus pseudofirmus OF4]ERN53200.1 hypothetical protein A33I_12690 [Alkalihalophilus marmarensis DSM 21297]
MILVRFILIGLLSVTAVGIFMFQGVEAFYAMLELFKKDS